MHQRDRMKIERSPSTLEEGYAAVGWWSDREMTNASEAVICDERHAIHCHVLECLYPWVRSPTPDYGVVSEMVRQAAVRLWSSSFASVLRVGVDIIYTSTTEVMVRAPKRFLSCTTGRKLVLVVNRFGCADRSRIRRNFEL